MTKNSNTWLQDYAGNQNSQTGEDGIIEKVLEVIGDTTKWCVEFGAWDGKYFSNTYKLIQDRGYSAVLIEGEADRYHDLVKTFSGNNRVIPMHAFVGFGNDDNLDKLLSTTGIPEDFDLLSIDIDGNDYHVWKSTIVYRPKVVVIEYNPTIPSAVEFVQPADMNINQGSSILSLYNLGKEKGYELVSATDLNCIFVDRRYFEKFGIEDNSVSALRPNESMVTYIFNGYDGTVFFSGYGKLGWHLLPYQDYKLQQLPKWLRQFPSNYSPFKTKIAKIYRKMRKRRIL
jgi:hypothetical protein